MHRARCVLNVILKVQSVTFIPADIVSIAVLLYETFDQKSTTAGPRAGERERRHCVQFIVFRAGGPTSPTGLYQIVVTH